MFFREEVFCNLDRSQLESKAPYYPVYSLVLYFGNNRWGGNQRLSDVVEFTDEYHDHLTDKFSDYKIKVELKEELKV
ncbi:MAG: hypothetical protein K5848_07770 [Lachnospiraceae bacterium]|nr:hypothetical protein [Lachnospiraceae bacterium]